MEKNTVLAIVLSVVVISGFYLIQGVFFAPKTPEPVRPSAVSEAPVMESPAQSSDLFPAEESVPAEEVLSEVPAEAGPVSEEYITVNTELLTVTLSNKGGDIVSWRLKEHTGTEGFVEMILSGDEEAHAFAVAFGNQNAQPVNSLFNVRRIDPYTVEFYRNFSVPGGGLFRLSKRYLFKPADYMFELTVSLDGGRDMQNFNFGGAAYTLGFGPQIGPKFEKLDQRYEYRNYFSYTNGKRRQEKVNDNNPNIIGSRPAWAAIAGKYFTFIAVPYLAQYDMVFSQRQEPGLSNASRLFIIRPPLASARTEDTYRFYLGPKNQDALAVYNNGNNGFGLSNLELVSVASTSGILAPLETALKWLLRLFQSFVHNWGIAIILLTIFVKVLFFPLTRKSSESTLKMQALSPKIKELQEKYKDNPQKLNAEMAEFYKKEGYNPVAGCLPMLLQIPIFFAMYNLFNNHFDLRGALFIPRWIPDLSLPESVYHFTNFSIPILGWTDIRLLPFIYVGSQLLYGKVTQTPDQQSNTQMKMMLYAMPVIFFFILYDVPSGLLIYWIMSNLLTLVQQVAINRYIAAKKAAAAAEAPPVPQPKIAPKKRKKR
ncbi:MAG: membrane protein insertase YidC [Treponema sp.]|jgi:YidC/Oxa1 family membrane protein insertase|nr:membrane protein insertase YidC [Treponema sp.]